MFFIQHAFTKEHKLSKFLFWIFSICYFSVFLYFLFGSIIFGNFSIEILVWMSLLSFPLFPIMILFCTLNFSRFRPWTLYVTLLVVPFSIWFAFALNS